MVLVVIRRSAILLWAAGIGLFILGSMLPWFSAVVGDTDTLISPRPIDDAEIGWMLLPAAALLAVLLLALTRVDGVAYRLVAFAGLCVTGFLAFMVVAILNVEHLGTDEYVIHIGRSITILAMYPLAAGCALALVSPTTRSMRHRCGHALAVTERRRHRASSQAGVAGGPLAATTVRVQSAE